MLPTEELRRLKSINGDELRVLALLSAAYGRAIAPTVLGNIERAAKAWGEGDDCLAYIHLAHARLPEPDDAVEAARRLFIADGFIKAGAHPRTVFHALALDPAYVDAIEKLYNEAEPRLPPGSGRASGEWTRGGSFLADLSAEAAKQLGRFALGFLPPPVRAAVAAFGIVFIPSSNKIRIEGEVTGLPGLKYSWNRDETHLRMTYSATARATSLAACCRTGPLPSIQRRFHLISLMRTSRSFARRRARTKIAANAAETTKIT